MSAFSIADLLVKTLADAGVERIWAITGDSLNGFNDSIRRDGRIRWMHVRHEESAAFAAGADAAITGKIAVCAGSSGPGNLHLINGLYDCKRNHVPVLAIASHIPASEIGLNYFQETHPELIFRECSDFVELISSEKQMPELLQRALNVVVGQRGVAVLVLPGDISTRPVLDPKAGEWVPPRLPRMIPTEEDLTTMQLLLSRDKNVTILAGSGCAGAHDEVVALAAKLNAPIVHAFRGKEYLEWDNPYDVGMTGLIGFSSGYHAMMNADTLLMLGTDFPYRMFYPKGKTVIQVDVNPQALGRRTTLTLGVLADVKETLTALLPRLEQNTDRTFLDNALDNYAKARQGLDDLATPTDDGKPLHPQYIMKVVSELADDDAIFTADVGSPVVWAARYLKMNGKRRLLGSFNHGSMANAMLQAMGAQAAAPDRQVISMSGDGGLTMMMGELLTLVQMQLPVKIIVHNNASLGFVELEMKAMGYLDYAVDLKNPNFAAMAQAMGLTGYRVENAKDLRPTLEAAFAHPGPVLVDVVTEAQELIMPPHIDLEQVKGFGLYMMKAVLNGRGNELIELGEVNLLR